MMEYSGKASHNEGLFKGATISGGNCIIFNTNHGPCYYRELF
jgi:hypothetical protein